MGKPIFSSMIAKLVLCLGSPGHVSNFRAYTRLISIDFPAPRNEVVLCPESDSSAIPAVVTETRIGGGRPVLVLHSDETLDSTTVELLESDAEWEPLQPAVALKGDVLGIFLDSELTDLLAIESWPEWKAKHTHFMISVGLVGDLPVLDVDGLDKPQMTSLPQRNVDVSHITEEMFSALQDTTSSSTAPWEKELQTGHYPTAVSGEENIVDMSAWKFNRDN